MGNRSVRLADVAAIAGVSVSTVSKVLNGGGRVSPETRARIHETAQRLDFRPNALAQFFATGKSYTIGFLTENANGIFSRAILIGAITELGKYDLAALLYDAHNVEATLLENVRKLQARRIDGLLVVGDELATPLRSVSSGFSVPVAYVRSRSDQPQDVSFLPDSVMAGRIATQHLIDIGRSRIAHVGNPDSLSSRQRTQGAVETLAAAGLTLVGGSPYNSDWTKPGGARAVRELLESGREFDAVFCANDQQAFAAVEVLTAAGRRVPDDVAIVGVDNFEALAALEERSLTTVDLNHIALGAAAGAYLVRGPNEPRLEGVQMQECTLVLGRSTMGDRAPRTDGALEPG